MELAADLSAMGVPKDWPDGDAGGASLGPRTQFEPGSPTHPEPGPDSLPCKRCSQESENQSPAVHVDKRHLPLCMVQTDPHPPGVCAGEDGGGRWGSESLELLLVPPHRPDPPRWAHVNRSLPLHGLQGHPHSPA